MTYCILTHRQDGVFDYRCMKLAKLCSQAMDYAKNGNPVELHGNLPKTPTRFKPDWHKAEVTGTRELDYYESERALGYMFRNIELLDPKEPIEGLPTNPPKANPPLKDPISLVLAPLVRRTLNSDPDTPDGAEPELDSENGHGEQLHAHYIREMRYICVTHTLVDAPDVRLKEEEVVLGTILANCSQSQWRLDRTRRMKLHVGDLVNDIRGQIVQIEGALMQEDQFRASLSRAWEVWTWAQHHRNEEFIESFSLIALALIFDSLKRLDGLPQA